MALVAWWPLNGDTDNYCNSIYNASTRNASKDVNGKIGNAITFNSGYLKLNKSPIFNKEEFSISFWFKTTNNTKPQCFGCSRTVVGGGLAVFMLSGMFRFDVCGINSDATNQWTPVHSIIANNTWYHITLTRSSNGRKLYINGTLVASTISPGVITGQKEEYFSIGASSADNASFSNYLLGSLNDYRIYDHALSEEEVREIAKAKILHWTFNENAEPTENLADFQCRIADGGYSLIENKPYEFTITAKQTNVAFTNIYSSHSKLEVGKTYTITYYGDDIRYFRVFGGGLTGMPETPVTQEHINAGKISITFTYSSTSYVLLGRTKESSITINQELNIKYQIEEKLYGTEYVQGIREGIVVDNSGFGNHGVIDMAASPKWTDKNKFGSGCYETGFAPINTGNDKRRLLLKSGSEPFNSSELKQNFTASFWFMSTGHNGTGRLERVLRIMEYFYVHKNSATSFYFDLHVTSGQTAPGTVYFNINEWNHIAITQSGNTFKVYKNGEIVINRTFDNYKTTSYAVASNLGLFNDIEYTSGQNREMTGLIDDFRIYAVPMTQEDIKDMYHAKITEDGVFKTQGIEEKFSTPPVTDEEYWNGAKRISGGLGYAPGPDNVYDPVEKALKITSYAAGHNGSLAYIPLKTGVPFKFTCEAKVTEGIIYNSSNCLTLFDEDNKYIGVYRPSVTSKTIHGYSGTSYGHAELEFMIDRKDLYDKGYIKAKFFYFRVMCNTTGASIFLRNPRMSYSDDVRPQIDSKNQLCLGEVSEVGSRYAMHNTLGVTRGLVGYWDFTHHGVKSVYPENYSTASIVGNSELKIDGVKINNGSSSSYLVYNYTSTSYPNFIFMNTVSAETEEFTLSTYIRCDSTNQKGEGGILYRSGYHHGLVFNGNTRPIFRIPFLERVCVVEGKNLLTVGTKHYLVATMKNKIMKLYVDGELQGELSTSGYTYRNISGNFIAGTSSGNGSYASDITVFETKFFNKALTDSEVSKEYKRLSETDLNYKPMTRDGVLYMKEFNEID